MSDITAAVCMLLSGLCLWLGGLQFGMRAERKRLAPLWREAMDEWKSCAELSKIYGLLMVELLEEVRQKSPEILAQRPDIWRRIQEVLGEDASAN